MATPLPSLFWTALDTPLGTMILAARGRDELAALAGAWFVGQRHFDGPQADWQRDDDHPLLREAATQLHDWHAGRRIDFDLPLAPEGSAFQQSIWQALSRIPHGRTCSYGELAAAVVVDAVARLLDGALGDAESAVQDSFEGDGLLDCPHYSQPASHPLGDVPEVLRSGNHAAIASWRRQQSLLRTRQRRPDLFEQHDLSKADRKLLQQADSVQEKP